MESSTLDQALAHRPTGVPSAKALAKRWRVQAAQEKSELESPVLPSYSMPKALICEQLGRQHPVLGAVHPGGGRYLPIVHWSAAARAVVRAHRIHCLRRRG